MSQCKELFTVFDYKNLLTQVDAHIHKEYELLGIEIGYLRVYFNPEHNAGIAVFIDTKGDCAICNMDFAYGNDFITVQFN